MSLSSSIQEFLVTSRLKKIAEKDKKHMETLRLFLDSEKILVNKEVKLGSILKGMNKTVESIVEGTSKVYSFSLIINEKIAELNHMNKNINLSQIDTDSKESLKIFAKANEVLKALVNDHKYTKDKEIIFSETAENGYIRYIKTIETFNSMTGGEELDKTIYYPLVESIIGHIAEGKTHIEKRDIMLQNLSKTLSEIFRISRARRERYRTLFDQYKRLYDSLNKTSDAASKEITARIIQDLNDIEDALKKQIMNLEKELAKIGKIINLEDDIKKAITQESTIIKRRT